VGDDLWTTRLRFYGYSGCAKLHGRHVALTAPPIICGEPVTSIDYIPEVNLKQIQHRGEGPRDMRADEVAAADEMLRAVCGGILQK